MLNPIHPHNQVKFGKLMAIDKSINNMNDNCFNSKGVFHPLEVVSSALKLIPNTLVNNYWFEGLRSMMILFQDFHSHLNICPILDFTPMRV